MINFEKPLTGLYCFAIKDARQTMGKNSKKSNPKKVLTNLPAFSMLKKKEVVLNKIRKGVTV